MSRLLCWVIAGGTWPALIACSASSPPTPPAPLPPMEATQAQGYLARDYFFPARATQRAVYSFSEAATLPSPLQSYTATGSMTVEVASLSGNRAEIRSTTVGTGENGQPSTETNTTTVTVEADGTVVATDGGTMRQSNAIFTPAGATVAPASGSIPAITARMLGTETITVPAGTFQTVHLQQGPNEANAPQTHLWVARGVGIVRQRMQATFPVQTGQNQSGQGSSTFELRLERFTP